MTDALDRIPESVFRVLAVMVIAETGTATCLAPIPRKPPTSIITALIDPSALKSMSEILPSFFSFMS